MLELQCIWPLKVLYVFIFWIKFFKDFDLHWYLVTLGLNYDQRIDVFSFGIVLYDILFETVNPYGENPAFSIDLMVSQDPNCRPEIPKDMNKFIIQNSSFATGPNVRFIFYFVFFFFRFYLFILSLNSLMKAKLMNHWWN